MLFYSLYYAKKVNISRTKAVVSILLGSTIVFFLLHGSLFAVRFIAEHQILNIHSVQNSLGRVFVLVPIVSFLLSKILKIPPNKLNDLFAFSQPLIWGTTSIGCLFAGCCNGYSCEWGIYNARLDSFVFPTQFFNALILIGIFLVLIKIFQKNHYNTKGILYPLMLIMVGLTRFFTEFLMDSEKILFGVSAVGVHCLVMLLVGFVWIQKCRLKN